MNFAIKLDCDVEDRMDCIRHQNAMLAASMMFNTYHITQENLFGIGPELYAEQWMYSFFQLVDEGFKDLVMIYFVKILLVMKNE